MPEYALVVHILLRHWHEPVIVCRISALRHVEAVSADLSPVAVPEAFVTASWAVRPDRNPKQWPEMPGSNMGTGTWATACQTGSVGLGPALQARPRGDARQDPRSSGRWFASNFFG